MTKTEAMEIEKKCDQLATEVLGEKCKISFNLAGNFNFNLGNYGSLSIKPDGSVVDWIQYTGFYGDLIEFADKALECIKDNQKLFQQLKWSYEHVKELED